MFQGQLSSDVGITVHQGAFIRKCPVCKETELSRSFLETGLPAYECGQCDGIWVSANEYLAWQRTQAATSTEEVSLDTPLPISDTRVAILCPDCDHILRRYKISPDLEFHLNRCGHCNGVWFDQNEWQMLKSRNLHHQVNTFFTEPWQRKLREEEMRRRFEKMYREKFGAEDYARIKEIRAWLVEHSQGMSLLAYLTDQDPYRG
jgi:Zn-finger nucleic acid-binding protein